ncbi:MAG: pseudouridine synthase [Micrococcales bacterium]
MASEAEEGVRLQKVLAAAGVASRRVCEQLIVDGKVVVNGKRVTELGTRINPDVDRVSVSGTPIQLDVSRVYLLLNKPVGVVSSMADENGRPDLSQFVVGYDRVFNVGRLDAETSGLIIMTNDGELAHKLAHPKFGVTKTYVAKIEGAVDASLIHKLLSGFELEDGFIKADSAKLIQVGQVDSLVEIVLHSGRNRIVRRMFDHLGHPVLGLVRKQFGPIHLGPLSMGKVRELSKMEVGSLLKAAEGRQVKPRGPKITKTRGR